MADSELVEFNTTRTASNVQELIQLIELAPLLHEKAQHFCSFCELHLDSNVINLAQLLKEHTDLLSSFDDGQISEENKEIIVSVILAIFDETQDASFVSSIAPFLQQLIQLPKKLSKQLSALFHKLVKALSHSPMQQIELIAAVTAKSKKGCDHSTLALIDCIHLDLVKLCDSLATALQKNIHTAHPKWETEMRAMSYSLIKERFKKQRGEVGWDVVALWEIVLQTSFVDELFMSTLLAGCFGDLEELQQQFESFRPDTQRYVCLKLPMWAHQAMLKMPYGLTWNTEQCKKLLKFTAFVLDRARGLPNMQHWKRGLYHYLLDYSELKLKRHLQYQILTPDSLTRIYRYAFDRGVSGMIAAHLCAFHSDGIDAFCKKLNDYTLFVELETMLAGRHTYFHPNGLARRSLLVPYVVLRDAKWMKREIEKVYNPMMAMLRAVQPSQLDSDGPLLRYFTATKILKPEHVPQFFHNICSVVPSLSREFKQIYTYMLDNLQFEKEDDTGHSHGKERISRRTAVSFLYETSQVYIRFHLSQVNHDTVQLFLNTIMTMVQAMAELSGLTIDQATVFAKLSAEMPHEELAKALLLDITWNQHLHKTILLGVFTDIVVQFE